VVTCLNYNMQDAGQEWVTAQRMLEQLEIKIDASLSLQENQECNYVQD
jgi:hypothetical protein